MERRNFLKTVATVGATVVVCPAVMAQNLIKYAGPVKIDHKAFGEFLYQVANTNRGTWGMHVPRQFLPNIEKSITDVNMWNRMKKDKLLYYVTKELLEDKWALGAICEEGMIDEIKYRMVDHTTNPFSGRLEAIVSYDRSESVYKFVFEVV